MENITEAVKEVHFDPVNRVGRIVMIDGESIKIQLTTLPEEETK